MKFHHIGIIVSNIDLGKNFLEDLYPITKISRTIIDKKIGVKVKFLSGKDKLLFELISPIGKKSPIKNLLNKKKSIINHLAYKVKNLELNMNI